MVEGQMSKSLPQAYNLGENIIQDKMLPYEVVRGTFKASFDADRTDVVLDNVVVPKGRQLKLLFLRFATQYESGAKLDIRQTNPAVAGQTGNVEAYPVLGKAPAGYVDHVMLESAGAEVIGPVNLENPIHVLEGSVDFILQYAYASPSKYILAWWGTYAASQQPATTT